MYICTLSVLRETTPSFVQGAFKKMKVGCDPLARHSLGIGFRAHYIYIYIYIYFALLHCVDVMSQLMHPSLLLADVTGNVSIFHLRHLRHPLAYPPGAGQKETPVCFCGPESDSECASPVASSHDAAPELRFRGQRRRLWLSAGLHACTRECSLREGLGFRVQGSGFRVKACKIAQRP